MSATLDLLKDLNQPVSRLRQRTRLSGHARCKACAAGIPRGAAELCGYSEYLAKTRRRKTVVRFFSVTPMWFRPVHLRPGNRRRSNDDPQWQIVWPRCSGHERQYRSVHHCTRTFSLCHPDHEGSIALMMTSDEEGIATHGVVKVVEVLEARNEKIDWCLVGEPSSDKKIGECDPGRTARLVVRQLTVTGIQGHVAYPELAENPIPYLRARR